MESVFNKDSVYSSFFQGLLKGDRVHCREIVEVELSRGVGLKDLYLNLFQKSLYEVGERWERGELSVATEHVATAIVNYLMTLTYEELFAPTELVGKAAVACTLGESHFLGARMVADYLEFHGFDTHFLGPHHEPDRLFSLISDEQLSLVGLSMSMPYNQSRLNDTVSKLLEKSSGLQVLLGGHGIKQSEFVVPEEWQGQVFLMEDLDDLDRLMVNLVIPS